MNHYIFFSAIISVCSAMAQPGSLDLSFGASGKTTTSVSAGDDSCNAIIKLSSGKLLAGGTTGNNMAFARYNANGTIDLTYNDSGTMVFDFGDGAESVAAMQELPDGKIMVVGSAFVSGNNQMAVLRLDADGQVDTTFGTNGRITIDFATTESRGTSIAVQADGKMIIGGLTRGSVVYKMALARLNPDASYDNTFSDDGRQTTIIFGRSEYINDLALQPDGKIIAVGGTVIASGSGQGNFAIVRYSPDGTLDTSFGGDGIVNFFPALSGIALTTALQPDGNILVGGYASVAGSAQDFALARLTPDGSFDSTFGTNGIVTTALALSNDWLYDLQLQQDGKIIAVGDSRATDGNYDFGVVRYDSMGQLDPDFGTGGIVRTEFAGGSDRAFASVLDGNTVIAAGQAIPAAADDDFALARYLLETDLSIKKASPLKPIAVFPNPAHNELFLSASVPVRYTIYDMAGKALLIGALLPESCVNISTLTAGQYLFCGDNFGLTFIKN